MTNPVPIYQPPDGGLIGLFEDGAVRLEPADIPSGGALIAVVPGEDILVADAEVPPVRQRARRYQAARYALEDQLARPVDNLHVALGARESGRPQPALVVDRERMEYWLDVFDDARGRVTAGMVPDFLCLPVPPEGTATLWLSGNRALLRTDAAHGFACEQELLPALLGHTDEVPARVNVRIQADTDGDPLLDRLQQRGSEVAITDRPTADVLLSDLLAGARRPAFDLLQDSYAPVSTTAQWWRPLRATAVLAGLWLILATGTQAVYLQQLEQRYQSLRRQAETMFRDAFPDVQRINNMRVQAQQEVRELRAARGQQGVFALLTVTARAVAGVPGLRMASLQYRNGELFVNLRGESVQTVEALRTVFAQSAATKLTVLSANASNQGVRIRARISPAKS